MNTPVCLPTAKLLKEKGFDKSTTANWWVLAEDHADNYKNKLPVDESKIFFTKDFNEYELKTQIDEYTEHNTYHVLSCPTISQVVKWLYKKHGIWICVDKAEDFNWWKFNVRILQDIGYKYGGFGSDFNSPTEAYESGIEHILNNLI